MVDIRAEKLRPMFYYYLQKDSKVITFYKAEDKDEFRLNFGTQGSLTEIEVIYKDLHGLNKSLQELARRELITADEATSLEKTLTELEG